MYSKLRYVIAFIMLSAAVVTAPLVNGYFFKKSYLSLITALNEDSPIKLTVIDYQRGWFSADAKLAMTVQPSQTMKLDAKRASQVIDAFKKVVITQHILHGPLFQDAISHSWRLTRASIDTTVHISRIVEDIFLGEKAVNGIMQVHTLVSYDNLYRNHIQVTPVMFEKTKQDAFSWAGLQGMIDAKVVDNFVVNLKSDLTWGAMNLKTGPEFFSTQPIVLQGDVSCASSVALCASSGKMTIPEIVSYVQNNHYKLLNLTISSITGVDDKKAFQSDLTIALDKLESPSFTLGPLSTQFSVKDLNAESLAKLKSFYKAAEKSVQDGGDYTAEALLFLAQLNLEFPHLIMPTSATSQEILMKTSYGNLSLNSQSTWPSNTALPTSSKDLKKINLKVNMRISISLVNETLKMLDDHAAEMRAATPKEKLVPAPLPLSTPSPDFPKLMSAEKAKQAARALAPTVIMSDTVSEHKKQFESLIAKGLVIQDNEDYVVSITYENNILKVNGVVIPLALPRSRHPGE